MKLAEWVGLVAVWISLFFMVTTFTTILEQCSPAERQQALTLTDHVVRNICQFYPAVAASARATRTPPDVGAEADASVESPAVMLIPGNGTYPWSMAPAGHVP